jgi:hypothetical protein
MFFYAHKLCSRQDAPLSCYILIVRGIKNTVDCIINGDNGKFDRVIGAGSAKEIANVIGCRFNMDGTKPPGSKVGLIDECHIWSFLMDQFCYEWHITFILAGTLIQKCAKYMIDHIVPADGTRMNDIVRNDLLSQFEVRSALAVKFGLRVRMHPN